MYVSMYVCMFLCIYIDIDVDIIIYMYIHLSIAIALYLYRYRYIDIDMYILSTYVCAHVCMYESARRIHFSVRARALVHECACVCARAAGAAAQHDRATARCDSPCVFAYV
jgi:hypothetical protein